MRHLCATPELLAPCRLTMSSVLLRRLTLSSLGALEETQEAQPEQLALLGQEPLPQLWLPTVGQTEDVVGELVDPGRLLVALALAVKGGTL